MTRRQCAALMALCVAGVGGAAQAAVVELVPMQKLARDSALIVNGVVEAQRVVSLGGRLHTVSHVRPLGAFKGEPGSSLEVITPGGVQGGLGQRVGGAPRLEVGEEAILFLERSPQAGEAYSIAGFHQGKFRVDRTAAGSVAFTQTHGGVSSRAGGPASLAPVSASQFQWLLDSWTSPAGSAAPAPFLREVLPGVAGPVSLLEHFDRSRAKENEDVCLYWTKRSIPFAVNQRGSSTAGSGSLSAVSKSFKAWSGLSCSDFIFVDKGLTPRTDIGFEPGASNNVNLVVWRSFACSQVVQDDPDCTSADSKAGQRCRSKYDCWLSSPSAVAITTATYYAPTGEILDADIELNEAYRTFSTACSGSACDDSDDIQNTVTHEVGHVVGLSDLYESESEESTMYWSAAPGETKKRTLSDDDVLGLCSVYPKGAETVVCETPAYRVVGAGCGAVPGDPLPALAAVALGLHLLAQNGGRRRS